ncbi:MAG: DUF6775 family putative metallopeptidase [Chloroflexota bacterium]
MAIILYDEGADSLDMAGIADYLRQKTGESDIAIKGSPFGGLPGDRVEDFAGRFAAIKVPALDREPDPEQEVLYAEIAYEARRLRGQTRSTGIVYDGWYLPGLYRAAIPREERHPDDINIVFTNRLFGTWDENNRRYHLRTSIYGLPSVISTTGIAEAPALPREYYRLKQQYLALGRDISELKDRFGGRFIDYNDARLTEVVKGYAMQAVFYSLTGEPFCEDRGCRLFNAHWQEDLIFAQLESDYEFCPFHTEFLEKLRPRGNRR